MHHYQQLEKIFEKLSHLHHAEALLHWDEAAMMPVGGGASRAKALATISELSHEILTHSDMSALIEKAKIEKLENSWQSMNLYWIEKKYQHANSLPTELVKKITETSIECEQAWRVMRAKNDWKNFYPYLEKVLSLVKESAQIRSDIFQQSPYDVLIDQFSPNITQEIIDPIFSRLKNTLPTLIQQAIAKQKNQPTIFPEGNFSIEKQKALGLKLAETIGFDFNHGRLDVSHHPFCGGVPNDVRMTTRYNTQEFMTAAMGVCHETGHARYEQNLPKTWIHQPVGSALGMMIHESQSLLIEMQVCRSVEFMQFLSPLMIEQFGDNKAFSSDNLYQLYTHVKPGYIRVDADEITYPLHIILRYELEKALIEGDMKVSELPDAWDEKMMQYLGLSTKDNFAEGVMQDVHWPSGAFGYFPAYTLGRLAAAQFFSAIKRDIPAVLSDIAVGNFTPLYEWLIHHIFSKASSVMPETLIKEATGEYLDEKYFIGHVRERYV